MLLLPRYLSMEPTSPFSVNTLVSSPALTIYAPSFRGCIWMNLQINNTPHPRCSLLVGRGLDSALAESRLQGARRGVQQRNALHSGPNLEKFSGSPGSPTLEGRTITARTSPSRFSGVVFFCHVKVAVRIPVFFQNVLPTTVLAYFGTRGVQQFTVLSIY